MSPPGVSYKKGIDPPGGKSWKKINEERKALKKQRKQDKILRELEEASQLEELTKNANNNVETPKRNPSTVSIAVPGSILENAQSAELRSYVAGQVARAACIFRVNEVIVFDDVCMATVRETKCNFDSIGTDAGDEDGTIPQTVRGSCLQLGRILQYLECPQYLRKFFFPLHKDLKYSGLLNPLDTPHHLRQQNVFMYREGIVSEKPAKSGHSFVNVGLLNDVLIKEAIAPGVRVTVKLQNMTEGSKKLRGKAVSPDEPRRETGVYWGYTVRIAHSLSEVFTKSPFSGGYDLTVGTSDRGTNVQEVPNKSYKYNHMLIVFGGLKGLEAALANDERLDVEEPELLFDHYINVLPRQGSRTIRTEEALLIAMAAIQEKLQAEVEDVEETFKELLPNSEDTGAVPWPNIKRQKKLKQTSDEEDNEEIVDEAASEHKDEEKPQESRAKKTERKVGYDSKEDDAKRPKKMVSVSQNAKGSAKRDLGDLSRFD